MKKFILSLTICSFVVAAYAGDACCPAEKKATDKTAKAAACSEAGAKTASCCPAMKGEAAKACPMQGKQAVAKQGTQKKVVKKNAPAVVKRTDSVAQK